MKAKRTDKRRILELEREVRRLEKKVNEHITIIQRLDDRFRTSEREREYYRELYD